MAQDYRICCRWCRKCVRRHCRTYGWLAHNSSAHSRNVLDLSRSPDGAQWALARTLAQSPVPVVCGVGHETDFTIADFAADLRAPTPTAAAELLSPDREALLNRLNQLNRQMRQQTSRSLAERGQQIDWLASRLTHPAQRLQQQRESLRHQGFRLTNAARWQISAPKMKLNGLSASLSQLDPLAVLKRGYAIAIGPDGKAVSDAATLAVGNELRLSFARGSALSTVNQVVATPEAD